MAEFITGFLKEIYGDERVKVATWGREHKRLVFALIVVMLLILSWVPCRGVYQGLGAAIGARILVWVIFLCLLALLALLAWVSRKILARNWQLVVGLTVILASPFAASALIHALWAAGLPVGLLVAVWLLARFEQTVMIFSGAGKGEFSEKRQGPWTPAVACDPCYRDWARIEGAEWVWIKDKPTDQEAQGGQIVWHRLPVRTPRFVRRLRGATLRLAVDDNVNVSVNGDRLRRHEIGGGIVAVDIGGILRGGENIIEMEIENAPGNPQSTGLDNPAGIVYSLKMRVALF